jgi:hypothetical protein
LGRSGRPKVDAVTPARQPYHAVAAVMSPKKPPVLVRPTLCPKADQVTPGACV